MALVISAVLLAEVCAGAGGSRPTAASVMDGVRVLYNNDGENLWAVNSSSAPVPYHECTGCPIDTATIRGSARDVAWVADVDLLCPFHNVPWWDSQLEPPAKHRDWYDMTFGFVWGAGGSQLDYVLKGGDFVGEFAAESVATGQTPFVTIRLNDGQMCSHPPVPDNSSSGVNNDHQFDRLSEFWWTHRNDSDVILGLQQRPPRGFEPCCWATAPHESCSCPNAACELSWSSQPVRDRIAALVGEIAGMYVSRGVRGIELDFERGLDYFGPAVSAADRRTIMRGFVRDVRARIDAATTSGATTGDAAAVPVALGVRLTPSWDELRLQGLDELKLLVTPIGDGGDGVTYINWGVMFYAYQPFDSDLASLVAALPAGTPWYFESTSWIGTGRSGPSCSSTQAKVRITKEELWTTALLANSYGGAGISVFNFVYTRPYFDVPCAFELNRPYSEPLFGDLNRTKDLAFLRSQANQFYRLSDSGPGQIKRQLGSPAPSYRIVAVRPSGGGQWAETGRLRLLLSTVEGGINVTATLNGVALAPTKNTSSLYGEGVQANMAIFPAEQWRAFEVPAAAVRGGNNTVVLNISAGGSGGGGGKGEAGYKLSHTGDTGGGDGHRWRFPYPYTSPTYHGPRVTGTSLPRATLLECERLCDGDGDCRGVYYEFGDSTASTCYAVHQLVLAGTTRLGRSYTRVKGGKLAVARTTAAVEQVAAGVRRLELSLPVVESE